MLPLVSAARQKPRLGHDTALSAWPGSMDSGALHESEESVSTPPLVSTARHVEAVGHESAVIVDAPSASVGAGQCPWAYGKT